MKITNLTNKKLWLAPLAGITDYSFRKICKNFGADVLVSEMVSAKGSIYNTKKTLSYTKFSEGQRPFGIQLFGSETESFVKAIQILRQVKPDFYDINMGCPVKKVVKKGAGSALMKNLPLAKEIVSACKDELSKTDTPLTAKIRSGWDNETCIEFALGLQDAGIDAIIIHPRTKVQMFAGRSNWDNIRLLKENLDIPVVGSGDVCSFGDIAKIYSQTKCDSVMIGRGAIGRPWIFRGPTDISSEEKFETIKRHYQYMIKQRGELKAIREMRIHLNFYIKGYKNSRAIKENLNKQMDLQKILKSVKQLLDQSKG